MRPTIILLSSPGDHQHVVARLQQAGTYSGREFFDRLDRGECSFGVDASGDVLDEFDQEEVNEIRQKIGEFQAITIEYSRVSCIRDLLGEVIQGLSGLLDTNHGELIEYGDVLTRFQKEPLWDWRLTVGE
ncbi:hypothetical protein ABTX62_35095 [Streptomyces sp. NPDC096046]|uniref:hypothetical protein n=1 Tax=Streptomyces sp. NPDC096046 TaxID=3155542 RepID=UPI003317865A